MTLAVMLDTDRTALTCDLAETYGVFDMYALPVETLAALAVGLRDDSRIMMKLSGALLTTTQTLLAGIMDGINLLCWLHSEDGRTGRNRPVAVLDRLKGDKKQSDFAQFNSGEDFEKERKRIMEGIKNA